MNLLYNIITRNDFQYSVFNTQFEYQPLKFASALSANVKAFLPKENCLDNLHF